MLNGYLLAVSLISMIVPGVGLWVAKQADNIVASRLIFALFLIMGAVFCLDGYDRANFLVTTYLENQQIDKNEFDASLSTIGLWKFVLPAALFGIGLSLIIEIIGTKVVPLES